MSDNNHSNENGTLRFCTMCRRSEKDAGRLTQMPGGICLCQDCMQRSMDMMNSPQMQEQLQGLLQGMGPFWGMNPFTFFTAGPDVNPDRMPDEQTDFREVPSKEQTDFREVPETQSGEQEPDLNVPAQQNDPKDQGSGPKDPDTREPSEEKPPSGAPPFGWGFPNIGMIHLGDLAGLMGGQPQVKQKEKPKKEQKIYDIRSIPAPHKIKAQLDEYVIGQEKAKKIVSVAAYNHYKRIFSEVSDDVEIEKSNMLMLGPTGCGKTYLVRTLARILDVPLAVADATALTEAGYIGDDIESVISKLLAAADNDVERCEQGIVFIDEIDKIARKKNAHQRDVSGESVQQGLLKLLEGSEVEVPVGAGSKNAMVPMVTVNTKNILFICGGAFSGLEDIIRERLTQSSSIGFGADLKDQFDSDPDLLSKVTVEDIRKFGMIPEFIGRLPVIFTLQGMQKEMLIRVLKDPKNAILKQYRKLLELDEVDLFFDDDALEVIAEKAMEKKTGARALRAILEDLMLDIMYEVPKDDNIGAVRITKDYVEHRGGPKIMLRGQSLPD